MPKMLRNAIFSLKPLLASAISSIIWGKLTPNRLGDASDLRFNDVLRRRFLSQVRLKEKKENSWFI